MAEHSQSTDDRSGRSCGRLEPRISHGLIVGKFRPPHLGHIHLIRSAAAHCDRLTVGCFDHPSVNLPLSERIAIFREEFPEADFPQIRWSWAPDQHPIDYESDAVWRSHVAVFRAAVNESLASEGLDWSRCPVAALFTSESYGDELAERLGIPVHVRLDQQREWISISATEVRKDPASVWEFLPAGTRARLAIRVVVVGAESTGTTTLSQDLALALRARGGVWSRTEWVPEFGRAHSMVKLSLETAYRQGPVRMEELRWSETDFVHIARNQLRMENEAAARGGPILICDTDSWATTVWQERYQGLVAPAVRAVADSLPVRGLHILTDEKSVPFVQDGYRDGERLRAWMNDRFAGLLDERGVRWYRAEGSREERVRRALHELDAILAQGWED